MAVSLTQLSQELNKTRSMAYYPADAAHMPVPHHHQYQLLPSPLPHHPGYQPYAHLQQQVPAPPPRPARTPMESLHRPEISPPKPPRPHSTSTATRIEPDPLPPHSNPRVLTPSQSHAFEMASPEPPLRIGRDEVWSSRTGLAGYIITREAAHAPTFLSTKPIITVRRAEGGQTLGTIRFHSMTTSAIDMTINGRQTSISHSGFVHSRWGFQSLTRPDAGEKWYWKKDKEIGGVKLEDSKKGGRILASIKGDLLTFEYGKLSNDNRDEVLLSAVAMAEAARRAHKHQEMVDLASAIGDFASSAGGSDGGGADGGGGGSG